MRLVAKSALQSAIKKHSILKTPLGVWSKTVEQAEWQTPQDVTETFSKARPIGSDRIIFELLGNDFRIIVHCSYRAQVAYIKFIGTHSEYDKIDPETVQLNT